jgi:hypothetical protein
MTRTTFASRPRVLARFGAAACAACCALPLAAGIVGAGGLGAAAVALEWLGAGLLAAAVVAFVARRRRRPGGAAACRVDGSCGCGPDLAPRAREVGCTLPDAELPGRGEAFRTLFGRGLLRREVGADRAVWTFAWSADLERDLRALAAAEQGCCAFWRFDIQRVGDELRWAARVPPDRASAIEMLDAIARGPQHRS